MDEFGDAVERIRSNHENLSIGTAGVGLKIMFQVSKEFVLVNILAFHYYGRFPEMVVCHLPSAVRTACKPRSCFLR